MPIAIRIFEPISLAFKDGAMPQLRGTVPAAPCLLCGGSAFPPSRMGCLDADGDQRTFSVCSNCGWNLNDEELKARTIAQLSDNRPEKVAATTTTEKDPIAPAPAPAMVDPMARSSTPLTAVVRPVPASEAWVQAAAREWTQQPPAA
jgi:hypothetical protein